MLKNAFKIKKNCFHLVYQMKEQEERKLIINQLQEISKQVSELARIATDHYQKSLQTDHTKGRKKRSKKR